MVAALTYILTKSAQEFPFHPILAGTYLVFFFLFVSVRMCVRVCDSIVCVFICVYMYDCVYMWDHVVVYVWECVCT